MSRKHYKTKNYLYAKGARKRYANVVAVASTATVGTGTVAGTKLSASEQFDRVAAVSDPVVPVSPTNTVNEPDPITPVTRLPVAADNLTPVTAQPAAPQTPEPGAEPAKEPETEPTPEEAATIPATNRPGNKTKWILLAVAAVVLFLFLRKK